jgi:dihydrolipoamide dehydrogenase
VGASSVKVDLVTGDKKQEVEADVLLSAIGVVANIEGVRGSGGESGAGSQLREGR